MEVWSPLGVAIFGKESVNVAGVLVSGRRPAWESSRGTAVLW